MFKYGLKNKPGRPVFIPQNDHSPLFQQKVRSAQNKPGDAMAIRMGQVMMEGPGSTSVLPSLSCTLESSGKFKNINQVNQNVQLQGQASAFPSSFLSKFQCMVGLGTSLIHKGKLGTGSPCFIVYWTQTPKLSGILAPSARAYA